MLDTIAERVIQIEKEKEIFSRILKESKDIKLDNLTASIQDNLLEKKFAKRVYPTDLFGLKTIGIDGGSVSHTFHILDIAIARAVAVIFSFVDRSKPYVEYFPNEHPAPKIQVNMNPMSRSDFGAFSSILRTKIELETAIEVIDSFSADIILLDGSIVPQPANKKAISHLVHNKYKNMIQTYEKLYRKCESTGILLVGVIKDSRGNRFMEILSECLPVLLEREELQKLLSVDYRKILNFLNDTDFLYRFLDVNERSLIFRYSKTPSTHPTLMDVDQEWWNAIYAFYLKTVEFDTPLRIEFLTKSDPIKIADKVASIILPLSNANPEYGIPSVIIEADARAKLLAVDLKIVQEEIANKIGYPSSFLKMRREKRIFK